MRKSNEDILFAPSTIKPVTSKKPAPYLRDGLFYKIPGGDLLSHTVTHAVPSALRGLTPVFGMGTGVRFFLIDLGGKKV